MFDIDATPGLLFVYGALLPLFGFVLIALLALLHHFLKRYKESEGLAGACYLLIFGEQPGNAAGLTATVTVGLALLLGLLGLGAYMDRTSNFYEGDRPLTERQLQGRGDPLTDRQMQRRIVSVERGLAVCKPEHQTDLRKQLDQRVKDRAAGREKFLAGWHQSAPWLQVLPTAPSDGQHATMLGLGFHIDGLAAVLFVLVALLSFLIHLYSLEYLKDELKEEIPDETVHQEFGTYKRRGRFSHYYLFLSLFTFAMLHLVIADNLFQVFLSWQLVALCAYLFTGFWYERPTAAEAATKVFLLNRAGDVALVAGIALLWSGLGTLSFQDMAARVRAPLQDRNGLVTPGGQFVYADVDEEGRVRAAEPGQGTGLLVLLPTARPETFAVPKPGEEVSPGKRGYGTMSTWVLMAAGLCLLFGCLTRAAQGPLYTWLTGVLEAPLPLTVLLQSGTMIAAGIYVLARVYPLLTPGVLLVIAYVGLVGMILGIVTALVETDLRRILTWTNMSQIGFILVGLGVGGWSAALFHLVVYSVVNALLFLGVGCVIYACSGETDVRKFGGLTHKMPFTTASMMLGVMAQGLMPFLAGWYSRDAILAQTFGYALLHPAHLLLFLGPLVVAGVSAFVLARMWIQIFMGPPREEKYFLNAEESQRMAILVVMLALVAVSLSWGWPPWDTDASWLEIRIRQSQPASVPSDFGIVPEIGEVWDGGGVKAPAESERLIARLVTPWVIILALLASSVGVALAWYWYWPTEQISDELLFAAMGSPIHETQPDPTQLQPRPRPRPVQRPRLIWDDEDEDVPLGETPPATESSTPIPVRTPGATPTPTPATPAQPPPREPAAWEVALQRGLYLDQFYCDTFVTPARWLGRSLAWIDLSLLDNLDGYVAAATVAAARAEGQVDSALDRTVRETARSIWNLGGFLRRAETGSLHSYLLCLILAAVGIAVCFYLLAAWG
jgi:NADH-quinone oxidoreductase subunit L